MKHIIKNIPNILTIFRMLLTPFIIFLSITAKLKLCIILVIIGSITDLLDGMIARKFNLTSELGAKLDAIADKVFGGFLVLSLAIQNLTFIFLVIGEALIAIVNIIAFTQNKKTKTKFIGKIKTTILDITMAMGFISLIFNDITSIINVSIIICFILQIICVICYIGNFFNHKLEEKTQF